MFRRRLRIFALIIIGLVSIYVLSFGPAARWVTAPLIARKVDPETYDRRLTFYYSFYQPIMWVESHTFWSAPWLPMTLERYKGLFRRSGKLKDSREVMTVDFPLLETFSREAVFQSLSEELELVDIPLPNVTELYYLPHSRRLLVITSPAASEGIALLKGACGYSFASEAQMEHQY